MVSGFVQVGIFWLNIWPLLNADSVPYKCDVHFSSVDFFGLLQWNCTGLTLNATFNVQLKEQGNDKSWRDVTHCVGSLSLSCNLSQEIPDFRYFSVRLGVEEWPGLLQWLPKYMFQLEENVAFSAPSLVVRVKDHNRGPWSVEVKFPRAPERLCRNTAGQNCSVIELMYDVAVSVTLFNKRRPTERQERSGIIHEENMYDYRKEFGRLVPGQEYCVVANFTSSPTSKAICLLVDPLPVDPCPILVCVGLCVLFCILVALYLLRQNKHASEDHLPRTLAGLLEPMSGFPIPAQVVPAQDSLSIISLRSCSDLSLPSSQLPCPSSLDQHQYFSNPLLESPPLAAPSSGSGGLTQEGPEVPLCGQIGWDPTTQSDGGPQHGEEFSPVRGGLVIPLSSLRLGLGEGMDSVYLHEGEMVQSKYEISTKMEQTELYHSETEGGGIFIGELNLF